MRVCILTNRFPVRSETFIVDHASELTRRGHDVVVIPVMPYRADGWSPPEDVLRVVRATMPTPPGQIDAGRVGAGVALTARAVRHRRWAQLRYSLERAGAPRGFAHRLLVAHRVAQSGPFDVVHAQFAWTAPAALALRRRGVLRVPVVCSVHGQDANVTGRANPGWLAAIGEDAELLTVGSSFMAGVLRDQGVTGRVRLWPQGVRVTDHALSPRSAPEFRVLSVGRLVEFKGVDDSLRVIAAARRVVPGLRYTVIGDGAERGRLEALAGELGVADITEFAGPRDHADVLRHLRSSHAYLQMGRPAADGSVEGQGVAPCEASAHGIPCVVTRFGGLTDVVVDGETGFVVAVGDVEAAGQALGKLASDETLRLGFGAAARDRMRRRFDISATTDGIERIYQEAISIFSQQTS